MNIIYEDEYIIVLDKPAGLAVQTKKITEEDAVSLLRKKTRSPYLAPVNRLDQPVRGLVLFAKTEAAAANLSKQMTDHTMTKIYRAEIFGDFKEEKGELCDRIYRDGRTNTSFVVKPGDPHYKEGKDAKLFYEKKAPGVYIIRLYTGRHHQIRLQLASAGHPILGDYKYGTPQSGEETKQKGITSLMLRAERLTFVHPKTKETMTFEIPEETKE